MRLAHQSGPTNVPVTVWFWGVHPSARRFGTYVVELLRQLGYRATLRYFSYQQFFALPPATVSKMQVAFTSFGADFPTASDYFFANLSCSIPNPSQYCNPHADELARQAQAAQLTDPAAARKLWAQVDRIVTDESPWVPVLTSSPTVFTSARFKNYQESASYGSLLDQIWIR